MLKNKRELFMRQKSGSIIPVFTYLFVNNMSRKHMILMFEPNTNFKVFEEPYQNEPFSYLLTNNELLLEETSNSFESVTGIKKQSLNTLNEVIYKKVECDDFIELRSFDSEIKDVLDLHEINEIEITFKNVRQRYELS